MSEERLVGKDGTMRRPEGVLLPVSLGLPYNIAELIQSPVETAILRGTKPYGSTVRETWEVAGQSFEVAQDERFERAERSMAIGAVRGQDGEDILVYQKRPPHLGSDITELVYSPR